MEEVKKLGRKIISDFDLGWLIGILDGEGSFSILKNKQYLKPTIQLSNTNFSIISKFTNILNQLGAKWAMSFRPETTKNNASKNITVAALESLRTVLETIIPYMECRFTQANYLFEFVNLRLNRANWNDSFGEEENSLYYLLIQENQK